MLEELRKINSALENIDGDKKTLEFRKEILRTRAISNKQLAETSTTDFEAEEIKEYCNGLIINSLENKELPGMPQAVENKRNSRGAKNIIQGLLETFEFDTSSDLLQAAYKQVDKAKTVADLKSALKVYALALEQHKGLKELHEHVSWLADMNDALEKEREVFLEYKRQNEEIFGIYQEDDEELSLVLKARDMKEVHKLSDDQICKVLGINRNRLNFVRRKTILVQNVDTSVEKG